jgi:hypothetical protein
MQWQQFLVGIARCSKGALLHQDNGEIKLTAGGLNG